MTRWCARAVGGWRRTSVRDRVWLAINHLASCAAELGPARRVASTSPSAPTATRSVLTRRPTRQPAAGRENTHARMQCGGARLARRGGARPCRRSPVGGVRLRPTSVAISSKIARAQSSTAVAVSSSCSLNPARACAHSALVTGPAGRDELAAARGQRDEHDAPVALAARPLHEPARHEAVEHLRRGRRRDIGQASELARRTLTALGEAEQQAVLRVAQLVGTVRVAPAQAPHRHHRALEA